MVIIMLGTARAGSFTAGDVVVYRVGSGSPLVNTGNPVFLDEYSPGGTLVQSIALPVSLSGSNHPLIADGTATDEGQLGSSADGQYLLLTGYDSTLLGTTALAKSKTIARTVGRVKYTGSIDTSTALTDFSQGDNPRGATSTDGNSLWVGGATGGVRYATLGGTTSVELSTDESEIRYVGVFDGQLYISTQSKSIRIGAVGAGLPTTASQSIINLPGLATTGSPNAFFFADLDPGTPGVDTLYVADDVAGLEKFSLLGGKWFSNGTAGVGSDAYRGVTGTVSGTTVTLYATRKAGTSGGGELVRLVDSGGFNATLSGVPTLVASAPASEGFRGVALVPAGAGAPPTNTPTRTPSPPPLTPTPTAPLATPTASGAASTATKTSTHTATAVPPATSTATPGATGNPTLSPTVAGNAFTPGDVVVYRVGDGAAALSDNGSAVFLDEYTTGGTLVQSVALPTSGAHPLLATTDASEGILSRSIDSQYLLFTGYDAAIGGATSLSTGSTAMAVPRVVGRVKYDGSIDTTTALTDMSSSNNVRSATSTDGTNLWVGGASGSTGGVHYTTLGSTTSTMLLSAKGTRQAVLFGGQLYFDSNATGLINVSTCGVGEPTTGGQTGMELPGLTDVPTGNDAFYFVDLGDGHGLATLYVANDTNNEVLKYTLSSGTWTAAGSISATGAHGVVATVAASTVTLYIAGSSGSDGTLYSFVDSSGFGGMLSGSATAIAMAGTNQAFRGLALAPEGVGPPPPTNTPAPTPSGTPPTVTASPTVQPTHTATRAATAQPTGTAVPTNPSGSTETPTVAAPVCVGDCDGNHVVEINEILIGVNILLGNASLDQCRSFDCEHTGTVSVACLIQGVNSILIGCPAS
jgi:hypothetical protein